MSKPLTAYFQTIGTPQAMQSNIKRKLSLIKKPSTPLKSSKVCLEQAAIICISDDSDDDALCKVLDATGTSTVSDKVAEIISSNDITQSLIRNKECDDASNSSASTIIYTPATPKKSLTPLSISSKSPGSRDKYYSPVKKKNIKIRSPLKVKKNLCNMLNSSSEDDQVFAEACRAMDDKTIFLLTVINKYLNDNELRPLLLQKSHDLLSKCMLIKKPGMRLVCRLYWRKEGWYRMEQVKQISSEKKNDIDDLGIQDMINDMTANYIIECSEGCDIDFEDYLTMLKLDELKSICKDLKLKMTNKQDAMECLRSYCRKKTNISSYFIGCKSDNSSRVREILRKKTGVCYRLTEPLRRTLDELYLLMYLGIDYTILREKRLELTLIYDKIKRECYPVEEPVDNAGVVFKTRDDFERYIEATKIYEDYLATTELEEKCRIVENVYDMYTGIDQALMLRYMELPPWLQRFTPPYLYVRILEAGVQDLKKSKARVPLALDILSRLIAQTTFRMHKQAEWIAEKALILDKHMSNAEEAALVLVEGFASGLSAAAADWLRPRARLLATRRVHPVGAALRERLLEHVSKHEVMEKDLKAKHIYKLPMDLSKSRGKIKFESRSAEGLVVREAEEFCIHQYIAEGQYTHGGHWEGRIVTTLFFLLFWDIIYARLEGVRGIYLTHYQVFPLDLFTDSFYANRKALIDARLLELERADAEHVVARLQATWDARPETELSGINRSIGWESVRAVGACLAGGALAALCRRLAAGYRRARSGFPDLTLWHHATRQIKFVEVKTDSDKPSMKQLQWMRYLQDHGIDTEFCYVGVNTHRCKARNS